MVKVVVNKQKTSNGAIEVRCDNGMPPIFEREGCKIAPRLQVVARTGRDGGWEECHSSRFLQECSVAMDERVVDLTLRYQARQHGSTRKTSYHQRQRFPIKIPYPFPSVLKTNLYPQRRRFVVLRVIDVTLCPLKQWDYSPHSQFHRAFRRSYSTTNPRARQPSPSSAYHRQQPSSPSPATRLEL